MQTCLTKSAAVVSARPAAGRRSVVARAASNESRRAALGSLLAGTAALVAGSANAIDLFDDRKARENGFDIIYEARDLDLPQSTRDGLDQVRSSLAGTKARIAEAERRVDGKLGGYVQKAYWTLAREELRGQLGTLRFDLNTVASSLSKDGKTAATEAKNEFLAAADKLDFAIRQKNSDKANAALATTQAALDAAIATLG